MPSRSHSGPVAAAGANLLCLAACLGAAALCVTLAIPRANGSPIWLPTGVALAALLIRGREVAPAVGLASALFNLYLVSTQRELSAAGAGVALLIAASNLAALLLAQRVIRALHLAVARDSAAVVHGYLATAAICAALDAAVGTLALTSTGALPVAERGAAALVWWVGGVTAMLVVTPLICAWADAAEWRRLRARIGETAAVLAVTVLLAVLVFRLDWHADTLQFAAAFLLLAPVMWAAVRLGAGATTTAVAIVAAGAVLTTLGGASPFVTRSQLHSLLGMDLYLTIVAVTGMVLTNSSAGHFAPAGPPIRSRWPVLMLALCLTVTVGAWHAAARITERRIHDQFHAVADAAWRQIDYRLTNYRRLLRAGKAFFDASEGVSAVEWHSFASSFDIETAFPGTQGLGYASWVAAADVAAFEREQQANWPALRIWPRIVGAHGAIVTFLEPHGVRNDRAMGYDMYSEPNRRAAMAAAARLGRIGSTGTVTLVQEIERSKQLGFLMYEPVYAGGAPLATPAQRLAALRGFIFSPFRLGDMVASMISADAPFTLRIWDGPRVPGREIFRNDTERLRAGRYAQPLALAQAVAIDETGRYWTVELTATEAFESAIDRYSSLIILALGTLISLLVFEVIKSLASTRQRALRLARDMTHEVQEQGRAVERSEARLRLFTASVRSHAIIFLDGAGNVEAWNEGAANLFGYRDEETVGRPLPVWDAAGGAGALTHAASTGTSAGLRTFLRKDGSTFLGEMQLSAVRPDAASAPAGYAFIVRDVTEAQAAEEQMRRAKEHAETASQAKSSFVANMSHELRTPMNAVLGLATLLGRTRLDSEQLNFVNMIRSSGQTLLAVLNDVLDFSRIEAGRIELSPVPTAPQAVAQTAAALMAVSGGGRLRLIVDVDPALPDEIIVDPLRLEQILTNLIGNALKFTEHGSVTVTFRASGVADDGRLLLRVDVRDTGIGMDPAQLQRLFSPFVQADASMSRRFGGTGLGLTIARGLAERMEGTIDVTSAPGRGSTFTLTVPVTPVADAPDRYRLAAPWLDIDVLLFESDAQVAAALAHATTRWGWRLHPVNDFDQASVTLGGTGPLPHRLALVGPGNQGTTPLALLTPRKPRLPASFAVIQVSAGFAAAPPGAAQAFAYAQIHAPATRATLHDAVAQLGGHAAQADAAATQPTPLAGMHLLLAEDHPVNQTVAVTMLRYAGAEVTVADNGRAAVDALRRDPERYAVVLMDVQMPELDGLQAARIVRDTLGLAVPIIAMTAGVTEGERAACAAAGMNDFIAKPVEEEAMVATVLRWRGRTLHAI